MSRIGPWCFVAYLTKHLMALPYLLLNDKYREALFSAVEPARYREDDMSYQP